MSTQNPFKVLGIDPSLVKALRPGSLKTIIESQYKTLQKIFHPDNQETGNQRKSRLLNWAKDELSKPQSFAIWKNRYLAFAKRKTASLLLEVAEAKLSDGRESTLALFESIYRNSQQSYVDILGIGEEGIKVNLLSFADTKSLQAEQDVAAKAIESKAEKRKFRKRIRDKGLVEFSVVDGKLLRHGCDGVTDYSNRLLVGVVTPDTIQSQFPGKSNENIYRFLALFGSNNSLEIPKLKGRKSTYEEREWVLKISPRVFSQVFPWLDFSTSGYGNSLFSMQIEGENLFFTLEGTVHHPLEEEE